MTDYATWFAALPEIEQLRLHLAALKDREGYVRMGGEKVLAMRERLAELEREQIEGASK